MSGDTLVLTTRKVGLPSDGWGSGMIQNTLQWTGMTLKTENYLSTALWLKTCSRLWHNEKSAASLGEPRSPVNREAASPHSRICSPQFMDVQHMEVIFGHSTMLINIFLFLHTVLLLFLLLHLFLCLTNSWPNENQVWFPKRIWWIHSQFHT